MFLKFFRFRYGEVSDKVNALILIVLLTFSLPAPILASDPVRIMALGDSLSAGYGLLQADAFPNQLQRALNDDGIDAVVINAGVSGDTSAGGLSRLEWALSERVDAVIIELGANDGLRGLDPGETFKNLDAILGKLKQRGLAMLLTGMRAPPNLGEDYGHEFAAIYPRLAKKHDVPFYPFFLEGVAAIADLNQDDTIHPNARGVRVVTKGILPFVKEMIQGIKK
ncbi:MAG: arylesterase [Rhodospirillaceae bacterium]|nr:arylesterase [Rhodospirillaceae bacterium]MBL6942407.1 arylesterase [Rhodospirillales bacterium]